MDSFVNLVNQITLSIVLQQLPKKKPTAYNLFVQEQMAEFKSIQTHILNIQINLKK